MSDDRRLLKLLATLTIFQLLVGAISFPLVTGLPDVCLEIDMAMIELYTRNAMEGNQFVGPYSRFGWNHPGPAYFYMLAPVYVLARERSSSLMWGALLINLIACAALIGILIRKTSSKDLNFALCSTVLLGLFLVLFGPGRLTNPWNPWAIAAPMMLFVHACTILASGEILFLPIVAIVGSFLVQTHVGTAPTVLCLTIVSFLLFALAGTSRDLKAKRSYLSIASAVAIAVVVWAPTLVEELTGDPGNLSKIFAFFAQSKVQASWMDAVKAISSQLSWLPLALVAACGLTIPEFELESLSIVLAFAQMIGLGYVLLRARGRGDAFRWRLCLIGLTAIFAAFWSASRIQGHIFGYLLFWAAAIGCVNWSVLLAELAERGAEYSIRRVPAINRVTKPAAVALLLIAAAINASLFLKYPIPSESHNIQALSDELIRYLNDNRVQRPVLLFNWLNWTTDSALILQLHKKHVPFAVRNLNRKHKENWPLLLGPDYQSNENKGDFVIIVGGKSLAERPGYHAAANFEDTWVYVKTPR
jgi:hypothetical protein